MVVPSWPEESHQRGPSEDTRPEAPAKRRTSVVWRARLPCAWRERRVRVRDGPSLVVYDAGASGRDERSRRPRPRTEGQDADRRNDCGEPSRLSEGGCREWLHDNAARLQREYDTSPVVVRLEHAMGSDT